MTPLDGTVTAVSLAVLAFFGLVSVVILAWFARVAGRAMGHIGREASEVHHELTAVLAEVSAAATHVAEAAGAAGRSLGDLEGSLGTAAQDIGRAADEVGQLAGSARSAFQGLAGAALVGRLIPGVGGANPATWGAARAGMDLAMGLWQAWSRRKGSGGPRDPGGPETAGPPGRRERPR